MNHLARLGFLTAALQLAASSSGLAQEIAVDGGYTATPSTNPAYEDTGGTELTDGDLGSLVWPAAAVTPPLVGWQNIDATVTFNFSSPVTIGTITAWFADSDGHAGVGLPESVRITTSGGFDQLFPVPNPAGSGTTVPIEFTGFVLTSDSVTLHIARDTTLDNPVCCDGRYEWTMMSEVKFFMASDPDSAQLIAPLSFDLGTIPDDPAQVMGQIPVSNAIGVAQSLSITGASFGGPDADNFMIGSVPAILAPGETDEISFTFDSGGIARNYTATLEIASNDPDSPDMIEVRARVIAPLVPATPYQEAVVADGAMLYWTFDEADDTENARSLVNDLSANELIARGAATRAPSTATAGGVSLGRAASFDATADPQSRFDALNLAPTTPLQAFVVEFWFNIDSTTNRYFSETFAEGGAANQPGVIYNFNPGEFEIFAGGRTGTPVTPNEWHHVVAAYYGPGNGVEIYLDGVSAPLTDRDGGYNQVQSFGRFAIGNTVQNPQSVTGMIDEYAIYDLGDFADFAARQEHVAKIASHFAISHALRITGIARDPDADTLTIRWASEGGKLYNLRSETGLSSDPAAWPIFGANQDLPATPPENSLTIPHPADAERFFVVESFPAPPVVVFSDDFESGPGDWTTGSDGADGTAWELGTPSVLGPPAAHSPDNCFATNLASNYTANADVWLRSPPIDLTTAGGATLHYYQFFDIEGDPFDTGSVTVLDAADNSLLAVLDQAIGGLQLDWERATKRLPSTALGRTVKIQFRLQSDSEAHYPGWYLDDIELTVP